MPSTIPPKRVTPRSSYGERWRSLLAGSPTASPRELVDVKPGEAVLAVVAHPDDETLSMGATLAALAHDGIEVHVMSLSSGEGALDHVGVVVDGLAERRRGELMGATSILGAASVTTLDFPDGRLNGHERDLVLAVTAEIKRSGASHVMTLWHLDPHPDHQSVSEATLEAGRALGLTTSEFPLWAQHWCDPDRVPAPLEGLVLVTPGERAELAKAAALAHYTSQTLPLADHLEPILPAEVATWPYECVVLPRTGEPAAPDFDAMYGADDDPWNVETSWYERRKLAVLLAVLPRQRYASAWEPGCGTGVVTEALAARVTSLVASDGSEVAVRLARRRLSRLAHVQVTLSTLPDVPVEGPVDLVVVAEFLYYVPALPGALDALWSRCARGGHVVFVHWAHHPHDAYRSGPDMHARIAEDAMRRRSTKVVTHVESDFLLDIYEASS